MSSRTLTPAAPRATQYGIPPEALKCRISDFDFMTSVDLAELFPDMPTPVFPGSDVRVIREAAEAAFQTVDLSRIRPENSVNILASTHGFTLFGGEAYAELVRAVRDIVEERTGCRNIRLRVGVGLRFREGDEAISRFSLAQYFHGKAKGIAPVDREVAIPTEIGTLYGLKDAYDADYIIHVHNNDIRETHYHRLIDRTFKAFAMSYARIETRSAYHHNLGPRGASLIGRAIYDSDFVQSRFVASCILNVSPMGVTGVSVSQDMHRQNRELTQEMLRFYGKPLRLFSHIKECIAVLDCPGPIPYGHTGGIIFANILCSGVDLFDLDVSLPVYSMYTEMSFDPHGRPFLPEEVAVNPAIRAVINNYSFKGYPSSFFAARFPTIIVGDEMEALFRGCDQNMEYMDHAMKAASLEAAVRFARQITGTDQILAVDGAVGGINVSESLRDVLLQAAPQVSQEVDQVLMPKWLAQRNLL